MWLSNVITSGMNEKGWVQRDLAGHLGVSQAAVSKWIRGKGGIEVEQAIRLALVLDHNVLEFVGRLWPEIAESDPVPSELRVLIDRATDAQVVEIVARARSIIESGRRRRAQPRPTITDTDHLAHAADRDDTKLGRSGKPHRPQPERSDDYDDLNQGEEDP